MPTPGEAKPPVRRRWRRLVLWAGAALLACAVLAVAALAWLLGSLDSPWAKRRLTQGLRQAAGVEVDYERLALRPLHGLKIEGLVVRSPERFRAVAPDLLAIGSLEVDWSPWGHSRQRPWLDRVMVHGLSVDLAADAEGRTSLTELFPAAPPPKQGGPGTPLSRLPASVFGGTPPVGRVEVDGVSLSLQRVEGGRAVERWRLGPLALSAETSAAPDGGWSARAVLSGGDSGGFTLDRAHEGRAPAKARASFRLELHAAADAVSAAADGRLLEQSFVSLPALGELLHLAASARFGDGRTDVDVGELRLAGGALAASARAELPDGFSAAHVSKAKLALDLGKLEALVPGDDLPGRLAAGSLEVTGEDLRLAAGAVSGKLDVEGKLDELALRAGPVSAAHVGLSLRARPAWSAAGLALGLDGSASVSGLALASGAGALAIDGGTAEVHLSDLALDLLHPLATSGRGEVTLRSPSFAWRRGRALVAGEGLAAKLRLARAGRDPWRAELDVPIERLRLVDARGRQLFAGALQLDGRLDDLALDLANPLRSRAAGKLGLAAGPLQLSLDLQADGGNADFDLSAKAGTLAPLAVLLPQLPLGPTALTLASKGRIEGLATASPGLKQRTELRLTRLRLPGPPLELGSLAVALSSSGTERAQTVDADVTLGGLAYAGTALGDGHLAASAQLDLPGRSLRATLKSDGSALPRASLGASLSIDRGGRTLAYDLSAELSRLGAARAFLGPAARLPVRPDLDQLALSLAAHGSASGLTELRDGLPRPSGAPWSAARGSGHAELRVEQLSLDGGRWSLAVPSLKLQADLEATGNEPRLTGELGVDAIEVRAADRRASARGLTDRFDVRLSGNPLEGLGQLSNELAAAEIRQDFAPELGPEDLAVRFAAERDRGGTIRLSRLELESAAGGTRASLAGAVVLGDQRHKLSLKGELTQDLARLAGAPQTFSGRGLVAVAVDVASPDLELFRTHGTVRIRGADVLLPGRGFAVRTVDGEIPVSADFSSAGGSVHFLRDAETNPYSLLRFADQHPLLNDSGFLSIASLSMPELSIAPLYGSLRIERNQISLSQLELGLRGGRVSGQCLLDWEGDDTVVQARIRASGVLSSHGEPFDGSASLVASLRDRSIDGHAEIVRIGRRHLLDLLDLQDPQHVNGAMNRVRSALALGYPDRVRLLFDHGFASALVTLGGLGRLIRIDELRGIPTEPIVDQIVASLRKAPEDP